MEIEIREVNGEWAVDIETPDKIQSIYFKSRQNALSFVKYLELADNVIKLDKKGITNALDLITRQQAELENLKVENQSLRSAANSLKMHYEEAQAEIESLKIFRGYAEKRASDYRTMRDKYLNAKSEAIKDFAERVKKELLLLKKECRKALDNDGVFAIERARKKIDNLVKEMVGENNATT